jgi:hypothetical protein
MRSIDAFGCQLYKCVFEQLERQAPGFVDHKPLRLLPSSVVPSGVNKLVSCPSQARRPVAHTTESRHIAHFDEAGLFEQLYVIDHFLL